jgi:Tfp pilus assembly PilM family ATPase
MVVQPPRSLPREMRFRRFQQDVFVGLDLSPGRIKLVGVTSGDSGPRVVCAADEVLGGGTEAPRFDAASVGSQVAAILSRLRVRPSSIALALGPGEAVARRLVVVDQEGAQMLASLAVQLGQVLGSEVTTPRIGFVRLSSAAPPGRVAVFAGAARPEAVSAQQRAVAAAGVPQGPVTTAAGALVNAWRACRPAASVGRRAVLLHVGETAALWVILDGDEPGALDAPLVGLASVRERAGARGGGAHQTVTLPPALLTEWTGRLRQEIARGLQAGRREAGRADDGDPYDIWVSGGGSRVPGFLEFLGTAADAPVYPFDPLSVLEWTGEAGEVFGPALVPALGAALQAQAQAEGGDAATGFDLRAPQEGRVHAAGRMPLSSVVRTIASDRAFRLLAAAVVVTVAGAAYLDVGLGERQRAVAVREARAGADSVGVAAAMARSQLLEERRRSLGGQVDAVRALESGRLVWPRVLHGIAAATPPTAWVSDVVSVEEDPATGAVAYRVLGFAASDAVAGTFAEALVRTGASSEARIERTSMVKIGRMPVVRFELAGRSGPGAATAQEGGEQ